MTRKRRALLRVIIHACFLLSVSAPLLAGQSFVSRSRSSLWLDGRPWHFVGANSYSLMNAAARGDTAFVASVLDGASAIGCTVLRTWAFSDGSDSLDPTVLQFRPGAFNERAFRALDFVVASAKRRNLRLLLPLVNSWDQFGGMNQYVRWRNAAVTSGAAAVLSPRLVVVVGRGARSYVAAGNGFFSHDDFYTDGLIRGWYRAFAAAMLSRINTVTGTAYADEPAILGWELANEPRSSDRSGTAVRNWVEEMARELKRLAPRQLIGTGEEGFDVEPGAYAADRYEGQSWLLDGSSGISYGANSAVGEIDFASAHLYPGAWNLTASAGTDWIIDHAAIASRENKVFLLGEFGVRDAQAATYASWLGTTLFEGGSGALFWQLDPHPETDAEGFALWCSGESQVCSVLRAAAIRYARAGNPDSTEAVSPATLSQNYPNPFNGQTTIAFDLAADGPVTIDLFNMLGELVRHVSAGTRHAGEHRELLDARGLASGAYIIQMRIGSFLQSRRLMILR